MKDWTESIRREMVEEINSNPGEREELEKKYGQVWDTTQLGQDFEVLSFLAPYVIVRRKSDGVKGSLQFQHLPRYYWGFASE